MLICHTDFISKSEYTHKSILLRNRKLKSMWNRTDDNYCCSSLLFCFDTKKNYLFFLYNSKSKAKNL